MNIHSQGYIPEEMPAGQSTMQKRATLGLPRSRQDGEGRFPLTPEGASMLVERGFEVRIETGSGASINYPDDRYAAAGADICDRTACLDSDIVISLAPLIPADARRLRRGALLMTLLHPAMQDPLAVAELLRRHITALALDLVEDRRGLTPFADILAEIDGRAAIARASAILADTECGKGILLGGVTGIVACEVMVIGSGIAACSAARSAFGLGALVRMFDNDVYSLRRAVRELGPQVIGSALHPHVMEGALRTADVVVATSVDTRLSIDSRMVSLMKRGVVVMDLSAHPGAIFPSLPVADLGNPQEVRRAIATRARICLTNPGGAVGRTAAMAMSNSIVTLFDRLTACEGVGNALRLDAGLRRAVYTFMGRVVNPTVARCVGARFSDINIYLTLS